MHLGPYLEPQTTVSPQVVLTSEVLQLPAVELEQRVLQELEENPALERVEASYCRLCGAPVAEGQRLCYRCAYRTGGDEGADPYYQMDAWMPERVTLEQHVWAQLRLLLPDALHALAELVVGYLDEHGFLSASIEELARRHGISTVEVGQVVAALREVEPVGIGARDAREALLTQIAYLSHGQDIPQLVLARAILEEHWDLLEKGERAWGEIARAQGVNVEAVRQAVGFIIRDLNPFPAQAWKGEADRSPLSTRASLRPDVRL